MRKPKFNAFNLGQLIITVAGVMFGVYGVIHSGEAPANAPVLACAPGDVGPLDGGSGCSPLEIPVDHPRPRPQPVKVDIPREPAVFNPDDKGNGSLKGTIKFSDGRAVEGMKVTAISTEATLSVPNWDEHDIAKTHKEYDLYFRELERNTRIAYSDSTGRFDFTGLDSSHSYRVNVNDPEIGTAQQVARSGGSVSFKFDVPVILEGVVTCENGKLPRNWWVTVNADSGQGYFEYVQSATFHDESGKFRIRAKAGKVQVVVGAQGWIQDKVPVLTVNSEGGKCEVLMVKAATLSGTVTSKDGSPLPSVTVMLNGENASFPSYWGGRGGFDGYEGERLEETVKSEVVESVRRISSDVEMLSELEYWGGNSGNTDQDGKYRIENLRPGTYTVTATMGSFSDSREVTIASGENFADFSIDAGSRVKIVARNDSGDSVTPSYAWFINGGGEYAQCVQVPMTDGSIEYAGIKEGTWNMTVQANAYPQITQEVIIGAGSNTFDVTFQQPGSLSGKVSSPGGKTPANLYVRLTADTPGTDKNARKRRSNGGNYYSVNADGTYRADSLQPGAYHLSVEFNQNDQLYTQDLHISAGENELDITIDERSTLTVTVDLAPEIKNKEGISIYLSKTSKEGGQISRYAQLDKNNQAEFSFLPEGEYNVMAYTQDGTQSYVTTTINRGGNAVTLSLGPPNCVKITQVADGYQAADAGVQVGDLIIEYNGIVIQNMEELVTQVQSTKAEDSVTIVVLRGGSTMTFRLNGGRIGINGDNFRR